PTLVQNGAVLNSGNSYTATGPFSAGIAYLQTGKCGLNGDECTTVEMTLVNPTAPGAGSSTDITLIAPHAFNKGVGFRYFNGCDGQGQTCATADCTDAFRTPTDYFAQTQCEENNVSRLSVYLYNAHTSLLKGRPHDHLLLSANCFKRMFISPPFGYTVWVLGILLYSVET
ncbi:hypothetical protein C8J55DRAFT_438018, partial [Lentinula edodes]